MGSRKDDPVFNVKFVQLVESKPCLWNSTLPAYSKKDEIQNAWQEVANETKDTVRNCRERWRTIRSSFLRSLKLSRTSTGRGKRKYYLSKYLQFLIPYTKTRLKNGTSLMAQRKTAAQCNMAPMTRISHMPMPVMSSDDTKDSSNSAEVAAIAEGDVVVSLHEGVISQHTPVPQPLPVPLPLPLPLPLPMPQHQSLTPQRLTAIKVEQPDLMGSSGAVAACGTSNSPEAHRRYGGGGGGRCGIALSQATVSGTSSSNNNNASTAANNSSTSPAQNGSVAGEARGTSAVDLTEFAEWIKSKNEQQRHCLMTTSPDADQSFLNSLHPFLKEMSGKQNRRFRQKVVALIDAILDNAD